MLKRAECSRRLALVASVSIFRSASAIGNGTTLEIGTGSAVSVSASATLGGTGTISGATTLAATGKLSPTAQSSGSKLTLGSTHSFHSGGTSIFIWDLSAANTPDPGVVANNGSYGQMSVTGAASNTAVFNIALLGGTGESGNYADALWDTNKSWNSGRAGAEPHPKVARFQWRYRRSILDRW